MTWRIFSGSGRSGQRTVDAPNGMESRGSYRSVCKNSLEAEKQMSSFSSLTRGARTIRDGNHVVLQMNGALGRAGLPECNPERDIVSVCGFGCQASRGFIDQVLVGKRFSCGLADDDDPFK